MKYEVIVTQVWTEEGKVYIEADSEDEARDAAREMLTDGSHSIIWHDDMDPGESLVESVKQTDDESRTFVRGNPSI